MKKSKILGIALVAAMAASMAVVSASALSADEMKDHTVGICGAFNGWGGDSADVAMTDDDGDGVWEGTVVIDNVTEDMITESMTDKGSAGVVSRGYSGVQFKIRLDGEWGTSWGDYEEVYDRTENSQTNCCAQEAVAGQSLTINVKLDTNTLASDSLPADDDDAYTLWTVSYTAEAGGAAAPAEESSEAPAEESSEAPAEESSEAPAEESSETPAEESSEAPAEESSEAPAAETSTETSAVPTGDTTSAVALVAVVVASLGAAVVMTKKASSKE